MRILFLIMYFSFLAACNAFSQDFSASLSNNSNKISIDYDFFSELAQSIKTPDNAFYSSSDISRFDLSDNSDFLENEENADFSAFIQDELNSDNSNIISDDYERFSHEEFSLAGSPRYTLTGDLPYKTTHIKPLNFGIFTGVFSGFMIAQHIIQMNTIWKEQGKFKFQEDGPYALYADKAGHVFGCFLTSYALTEGFLQSGLSWEASTVWGSIVGLSYSTYVEILDGYGKDWGFSPTDFYADVVGSTFQLAQYYVPFLQNFTPKFQYFPADWHGEKKRHPSSMFIDDYSSHSLWLSVNVHNLLPRSAQDYWPSWLELAFGYAVRGICDKSEVAAGNCIPCKGDTWVDDYYFGSRRFMISLDYNLIKMLPDNGGNFVNWLKQTFNYFKLPSPTLEFGPTTKFYLVYPFHIQL